MAVFTGAGVAIVTPFKENGEVNYEEFAKQIELQIAGETDAIIVCGTTGEASTLSHEEHLDVIRYCMIYDLRLINDEISKHRRRTSSTIRQQQSQELRW